MRVRDFAAPVDYDESIRPGFKMPIYQPRRRDVEVINRLGAFLSKQEGATCPTDAEIYGVIDYVLRDATTEERAELDMAQAGLILLASIGQVRELEALLIDWQTRSGELSPHPPAAPPAADPEVPVTPPPTTTPSA